MSFGCGNTSTDSLIKPDIPFGSTKKSRDAEPRRSLKVSDVDAILNSEVLSFSSSSSPSFNFFFLFFSKIYFRGEDERLMGKEKERKKCCRFTLILLMYLSVQLCSEDVIA